MDPRQHPGRKPRVRRGWYTLSVDALRGWTIFLGLFIVGGAGYLGYRYWQADAERREATALIAEAEGLVERLRGAAGADRYRTEIAAGRGHLEAARQARDDGQTAAAWKEGALARNRLLAVVNALERRDDAGDAAFISVHGDVEYRRGESGEWEAARGRASLASGDYVRTGAHGSAEIMFADGTLYTVRPNTSFIVSRGRVGGGGGEQAIAMEYGWVNLNTAGSAARVATPTAEARVKEDSEAFVGYEKTSRQGRFGSLRGVVEVVAGSVQRRLSSLQEVVQVGDRLSEPRPLPGRPEPAEPTDNAEFDSDKVRELVLAWGPVGGAARYALQVSRNHLFVDNVIDVDDRTKTRATLGLRGGGSFLWRVAAIARDGALGPWSAPRAFRVAVGGKDGVGDHDPPPLDLDEVTSYGNIFIVGGKTEPGSTVEIGGEPVKVAADGSFTKTIQLNNEGWNFIEIRARDAWGNETARRHRVFVDVP
jgi:Glucodextranase, domain B/FecR protein